MYVLYIYNYIINIQYDATNTRLNGMSWQHQQRVWYPGGKNILGHKTIPGVLTMWMGTCDIPSSHQYALSILGLCISRALLSHVLCAYGVEG